MLISIEISMYPLTGEFIPPIDTFLEKLHRNEGLKVQTNNMSTQVFGESAKVFSTLEKLISETYESLEQCPFVIKVLKGDVSEKEVPAYK